MAGVSVSHAILFIASMVVAAAIAGVLVAGVDQVGESLDDRSGQVSDNIETNIEIISDPGADNAIYDGNGELQVLVKNTGSLDLAADPQQLEILIDGRIATGVTVEPVDPDTTGWQSGSVIRVTVTEISGEPLALSGDTRVQITVNGDRELLEFRV